MNPAARPRRSKSSVAITAGVIALAAALMIVMASQLLGPGSGIDAAMKSGKPVPAPTFDLAVLSAGTLSAELRPLRPAFADGRIQNRELLGTPVVLNLWASWCEPCRTEAPALRRASAANPDVLFLGLNSLDARSKALAFLEEYALTYPNVLEGGNDVARDYGSTGLPETFFIDARGRIVAHAAGAVDDAQLTAGLSAARTGNPAPVGP